MDSRECTLEGGEIVGTDVCVTKSDIAKKNQAKGDKFEQKILRRLKRSNCIVAVRSSGSKGTWDLMCITPEKVRLIQAKTNGYLNKQDRADMYEELQKLPDYVQAEVEYYISPKKNVNHTIKKSFETDWDRVKDRIDYFKTARGVKESG